MFNSFGNILRLTSFGESHGKGVGGVIDGFPAGVEIDMEFIQQELNRRRPGQSAITTARKEPDEVELLSGVFEEKRPDVPSGLSFGTKTNTLTTITTSKIFIAHRMPTIRMQLNTEFAITAEEVVPRHAKQRRG